MLSNAVLLSILVALVDARFAQEQLPIAAISAVTSGGAPGAAATLAGSAVSTLLAAANPCAKLQKADEIIAQLGTGADALAAALGLVAAEQNFNPFAVSIPSICADASLPASAELRGVTPLIDPAVVGADIAIQLSATSIQTPFDATGLSVAEVLIAQGFSNFTAKDASGAVVNLAGAGAAAAAPAAAPAATPAAVVTAAASADCAGTTFVTVTKAAAATAAPAAATPAAAAGGAVQASSIAGLDFGTCIPTVKFEAGLNGRKDTEFTFQAIDPAVNKGQQEALNPNIITNRICDQLGNVCGANDAALTACVAAKAQILALGTRDVTTADAWNTALGFAGTNTNPDNAPQAGLVGHT